MQEREVQIAAFDGGELKLLDPSLKAKEVVLALPLTRLIAKMVRVEKDADPVEIARPILKAMSPFPDDELAVSCEKVFENEGYSIYLAAALPESAADDIAEALDVAKLSVVKIDALALGQLRGAWGTITTDDGARRLIRIKSATSITIVILDGDHPVAIRAVANEADMPREELMLQLEAEDFGGERELKETIEIEADDAALQGIAERSVEPDTLDVLPDSWREVLAETRFKAKLTRNLAIAGGVWLLVIGVLFGVPIVYGYMTDYQQGLCKQHSKAYQAVKDKKERTELVQKYSDHSRGALEMMKAISDRLPETITLGSWDFKRGEGLRFRGESDDRGSVLEFKDAMAGLTAGGEEGDDTPPEDVFKVVKLGAITERKGKQNFDLELKHEEAQDE